MPNLTGSSICCGAFHYPSTFAVGNFIADLQGAKR
jgi:hypothetical protein